MFLSLEVLLPLEVFFSSGGLLPLAVLVLAG